MQASGIGFMDWYIGGISHRVFSDINQRSKNLDRGGYYDILFTSS